jgi:hypothetical protein
MSNVFYFPHFLFNFFFYSPQLIVWLYHHEIFHFSFGHYFGIVFCSTLGLFNTKRYSFPECFIYHSNTKVLVLLHIIRFEMGKAFIIKYVDNFIL